MSLNFNTLSEYVEMHHPNGENETCSHRARRWIENGTILRTILAVSFLFIVIAALVSYCQGSSWGTYIEPWGTISGVSLVTFGVVSIFEIIRAHALYRRVGLLISNRINQLN